MGKGSIDEITLRRTIEKVQALPTLPSVLRQILEVIENPNLSLREISQFVSSDPTLTMKMLKMVNSPVYGFPGRISSITQALLLLGLNVVKGLLLGVSVFDLMQRSMTGLWEHSLACAIASRVIAKKKAIKGFEEVSIAGLLHDLGKVILIVQFPREYGSLIEAAERNEIPIHEVETAFFGVTHADVAVWMTEKWNFPKNLVEMMGNHHRPSLSPHTRVETAIVHLSDILVKARGFGFAGDRSVPAIQPMAWKLLDLSEEDLRDVLRETENGMEESAGLFSP